MHDITSSLKYHINNAIFSYERNIIMKFNEIMHLSFYTDQMDEMRDFYENKLGLKAKIIMRYEAYKGKKIEVLGQNVQKQILRISLISLLN